MNMWMKSGAAIVVCFSCAAWGQGAPGVGLVLEAPMGLSDDDRSGALQQLSAELSALGLKVKATPALGGACAGNSACVETARLALAEPLDALMLVEFVRVGGLTEITAPASAGAARVSARRSFDGEHSEVPMLSDEVVAWARAVVAHHTAAAAPTAPAAPKTLAETGGLFGLGIVIAPKVGGALGSVLLEGAGATLLVDLEVGYALPLELPRGHDLEIFTSWGYSAPASTSTLSDPRLPGGSADYTLTLHTLSGTTGLLYRLPIDAVDWWRLYAAAGARTQWSWTVIDGRADAKPFGTYVESAFDIGCYAAVGSEFRVGPGAIALELQSATTFVDRFVQRKTINEALQLAVGYRFFL